MSSESQNFLYCFYKPFNGDGTVSFQLTELLLLALFGCISALVNCCLSATHCCILLFEEIHLHKSRQIWRSTFRFLVAALKQALQMKLNTSFLQKSVVLKIPLRMNYAPWKQSYNILLSSISTWDLLIYKVTGEIAIHLYWRNRQYFLIVFVLMRFLNSSPPPVQESMKFGGFLILMYISLLWIKTCMSRPKLKKLITSLKNFWKVFILLS